MIRALHCRKATASQQRHDAWNDGGKELLGKRSDVLSQALHPQHQQIGAGWASLQAPVREEEENKKRIQMTTVVTKKFQTSVAAILRASSSY